MDELNIQSSQESVSKIRELCVKNISEKFPQDKLYEIFFIYGDISNIEFIRKEVKLRFLFLEISLYQVCTCFFCNKSF
jgi:hypothetical protein